MKNVIKLTLAVAFALSTTSLFAQKFGRINSQEIISTMPEAKTMETNLQAYGKDLNDALEAMKVEMANKLQEYQKNYSTMTEAIRNMQEKSLQDLQARSQEFEQTAQQDYQKKYSELLAPIIEKAKAAIDKVCQVNGFFVVFDLSTGSLAYFDEAQLTDVAPLVKKELGIVDAPATPAAAPAAAKK